MPTSKVGKLFLPIFSLWLVYHVVVIVLMPNGASYPGRVFSRFIYPYAAVVGLNVTWNFFSPDPAHTMYLQFTLFDEPENPEDPIPEPRVIYLPESKDQGEWNLGKRRELYAMRYMLLDPRRIEVVLGPWLCQKYAPVSTIHIEHIVNSVPSLDQAVLFQSRELQDMSQTLGFPQIEYSCDQMSNEVGL